MDYTPVAAAEFSAADLIDWRVVLRAVHAEYRCGSFPAATALAGAIAEAAEAAQHHPDVDIRYPDRVRVALTTHATGGLTTLDVDLARTISSLAAEAGATAQVGTVQTVEIAIDTMDPDRIRPFWAAVLGYQERDGDLYDPDRSGPPVWFQVMDEPRHRPRPVPHRRLGGPRRGRGPGRGRPGRRRPPRQRRARPLLVDPGRP